MVVEDLHFSDGTGASRHEPVENAPRCQMGGNRRQQAVATVDVARSGTALDHQYAQWIGLGQRQRKGGAADPCSDYNDIIATLHCRLSF